MKKIILGIIFVFATLNLSAITNKTKSAEIVNKVDCSQVYDIVWYAVANATLDMELAFDIAMEAEHDCLGKELFG
ncbi:MAG: hypothetical protein GQ540_01495 [Lutibacter sp.]|uniref:hypothetical protein n=1 Tax=Lutibacter sp. TaxID=1925666 RepID=UPI0019EBD4DD|nr:hypothetical protein [Lutibacter sp.]NOR27181.1 hypothetical protein [Lutibacter sp.]